MAVKHIVFSENARRRVADGLNTLANAVKVTLGPRGRNVLVERPWGAPLVTKDGVSVAKEIDIADKFANMGVQVVKEVAEKTSDVAGDGTTTATVLTQVIYNEGARLVAAGHSPIDLKRGVDAAVEKVVAALKELRQADQGQAAEIAHVGTISANGETRRSATCWPRRWRRWARRGSSRSRRTRRSRRCSTWSRACSSTAGTCRPTSSPTPRS